MTVSDNSEVEILEKNDYNTKFKTSMKKKKIMKNRWTRCYGYVILSIV